MKYRKQQRRVFGASNDSTLNEKGFVVVKNNISVKALLGIAQTGFTRSFLCTTPCICVGLLLLIIQLLGRDVGMELWCNFLFFSIPGLIISLVFYATSCASGEMRDKDGKCRCSHTSVCMVFTLASITFVTAIATWIWVAIVSETSINSTFVIPICAGLSAAVPISLIILAITC
jgi:uncharacterized membrane protein